MRMPQVCTLFSTALLLAAPAIGQDRTIRMPRQPVLTADGETIVFVLQDDLWRVSSRGGTAMPLTWHPASDSQPVVSPDSKQVAFVSSRNGGRQIFVVPITGGAPRQVTRGSTSNRIVAFTADGKGLYVTQRTDRGFRTSNRLFEIRIDGSAKKRMLLDVPVGEAAVSPDGTKVLFTRGRSAWSRKGHRGSPSSQMWFADLTATPPAIRRLDKDRPQFQNVGEMNPIWAPDGQGYYFVSDPDGTFDVYYRRLDGSGTRRVTSVGADDGSDDGVAFPSLSADGKKMLFRRRFDLAIADVGSGRTRPVKLAASGDQLASFEQRLTETSASAVAFTADGKQMAFVAGEDIWVMDRILREPRRVTNTPHREASPCFSHDGKTLYFVSDAAGEIDIWSAKCSNEDGIWWLEQDYAQAQVTDDRAPESALRPSPTGKHVGYVKGTDLFVMDADGSDHRRVAAMWSAPSFDWSPDGKWVVYSTQDDDYNRDIWVTPLDGTRPPFNLSRHPDTDSRPVWMRDGKRIAWVGRREGDESDIYYVTLVKEAEEQTSRDRKMEKALEAMKKKKGGGKAAAAAAKKGAKGEKADKPEKKKGPADVVIDFDGIHDRVHRISNPDSGESALLSSPDGKTLAFSASVRSQRGYYTVTFPDKMTPKKIADSGLSNAVWLADTKEMVGLKSAGRSVSFGGRTFFMGGGSGTPAAMSASGKVETFDFSARRIKDWRGLRQVAFDQGWRAMRDRFYDPSMNNRDWEAIRAKYRPVAAQCLGAAEFSELMNMMLGELNASHMGHRGGTDPLPDFSDQSRWSPTTYHLGLRFALHHEGKGLKVESVIPGGPTAQARSLVEAGEIITAIDGKAVDGTTDLDALMTMDEVRDVELTVAKAGAERTVTVRPVASVQGLLYDEWTENNRKTVERLSDGRLGYLHIQGMNMRSFRQMEEDLYHAGHGKDGLIIDVRFNGGGSTTDHVMTALTQPRHAITMSRGSGEGYPQDRKVYASWHKPIVLMCNESSFSNAEILSHAVKQVGRGRLVGMRTAGGVISTGSQSLIDGSSVRMPTRGWYLATTGEDMELNGCEPDIALWNMPGGPDRQLEVAIKTLADDVAAEKAAGAVKIVPAALKRSRASNGR